MIKIQVKKQDLYLEPNTTLRFELISKLFDDQVIALSVIYPFNIPAPANQHVFEFTNQVEVLRSARSFECEFFFDGYPLFNGLLYVKNYGNKYYRCSIVVNPFSEDFSDNMLSVIDYGGDIDIGGSPHNPLNVTDHAKQITNGFLTADYTFPLIFAPEFYGSLDSNNKNDYNKDWGGDAGDGDVGKYLNNYSRSLSSSGFPVNEVHEDPDADNVYAMLPTAYLKFVLEKVFASEGFGLFGDFINDAELQKLILFNNTPLDEKYKKYFVKASMTSNQDISIPTKILFEDDSTPDNEDVDNRWEPTNSIYTVAHDGYHDVKINIKAKSTLSFLDVDAYFAIVKKSPIAPAFDTVLDSTSFVCANYQTWYEFDVAFNEYLNVGDKIYFLTNFVRDAVPPQTSGRIDEGVLTISNASYQNLNQFSNILNLQNHVPDVTVGSLINNIAKTFGLAVFTNTITREVELSFKKDILLSTGYLDLTESLIIDTQKIEHSKDDGFLFFMRFDEEFADYSEYEFLGNYATFDDLPTPTEANKVAVVLNLNVAFIFSNNEASDPLNWVYFADVFYPQTAGNGATEISPDLNTLTMHIGENFISPQYKDIGSSPAFETGKNDIGITLMLYRGLRPDKDNDYYPLASCTKFDTNGNSTGDYEMTNSALFADFLQSWYEFIIDSETVKMKLDCNVKDIIEISKLFSPQRKNPVRKVRIRNINYLPKKFSFVLSMNGINETEATLVK